MKNRHSLIVVAVLALLAAAGRCILGPVRRSAGVQRRVRVDRFLRRGPCARGPLRLTNSGGGGTRMRAPSLAFAVLGGPASALIRRVTVEAT